jgi:tetratricopeptide (TPR) repeat protein
MVLFWVSNQFLFVLLGAVPVLALVFWPILSSWSQLPSHLRPVLKEFQAGNVAQALLLVNQSIQAYPETWQAYQLRSVIHYSRLQVAEAERDARTALKLKPDSFYNHNALGQALLIQGRYIEAKEAFSEALRLAPKQAMNHNLGIACYRSGEYATAVEALAKATQTELPASQKLWVYYLLGRSFEALGQQDRAEQTYQAMQRYRDGFEKLVDSVRDKPDYPDIALVRADIADIERRLV